MVIEPGCHAKLLRWRPQPKTPGVQFGASYHDAFVVA